MWKRTWRSAEWTQPQCTFENTWEVIPWQTATRHNTHLHMQIANQTQFGNFRFQKILRFYTLLASPHLFGSLWMLLDLHQHAAKCAMKHMSIGASRAKDAYELANTSLEDIAISLHPPPPSKQHPSKHLFIFILPFFSFLFRPLSCLVLHWAMQMKNSSRPDAGSNVTLKFFQPPLPAFCSRLARELSRTTFLTNAQ